MVALILTFISGFIAGAVASALFYRRNKAVGDKIIQAVEDKINNSVV